MKIIKVNWLSEDAKEAEVHLFDGKFSIIAFSHPFNQSVGDIISLPLHAINVKKIHSLTAVETFSVERKNDGFEYSISGQLLSKELNQIIIGQFIIELDVSFPSDLNQGDYLSFTCDRLDLY